MSNEPVFMRLWRRRAGACRSQSVRSSDEAGQLPWSQGTQGCGYGKDGSMQDKPPPVLFGATQGGANPTAITSMSLSAGAAPVNVYPDAAQPVSAVVKDGTGASHPSQGNTGNFNLTRQ